MTKKILMLLQKRFMMQLFRELNIVEISINSIEKNLVFIYQ